MADLLGDELEVWVVQFVGLTQNRVEWLVQSVFGALVLTQNEHCDVYLSKGWIFDLAGFLQQTLILHDLCNLLQHANWFIELHWHRYLAQILTNRILDDLPNRKLLLGVL